MPYISLPSRALSIGRTGHPRVWVPLFGSLLIVILGGWLAWYEGPGLWQDWKISRNPVIVYDSDVTDGKCTSRQGVFTDCKGHLSYNVNGRRYQNDVRMMFIDVHSGDYMVDVVASADDPSLATMSIGIDKIWNRLITFVVLAGGLLALGLWLFFKILGIMGSARAMAKPGRISLERAEIVNMQGDRKSVSVTFSIPGGSRPKTKYQSLFRKGQQPLLLKDDDGTVYSLAAVHEGSTIPALMDETLARLDLTESERTRVLSGLPIAEATPAA